ncbi:D-amino-acid transaminase [Paenirhodobacter sp.]|uniref:D-amino-acid transaminase n=1 Tax=Paenirhodobacter sp. TaxID=1965326 RepID=UPI003B4170B1
MRQIYVNGVFQSEEHATIPVMDRGFLFGDAIYEVTAVIGGRLVDNDLHLARFERSLGELGIPLPLPLAQIREVQHELMRRNAMTDGTIYLQVSRGTAERNFLPPQGLKPNFVAFTQPKMLTDTVAQRNGISVLPLADPRWNRRDIKTVMLLGQVLAKQQARAEGYDDVWLHEDGVVTEGASSTAFILSRDGAIVTRPNSTAILPGCTRRAVLRLIETAPGLRLEERAFTLDEARGAAEAFLTSASNLVLPVVRIGEAVIGDGTPGPVTRELQRLYLEAVAMHNPEAA